MALDNVMTAVGLQALMDGAVGHATIGLNGAKIYPFTNEVAPTKTTTAADLTAATFTGSAAKTITWGTPYLNASGDWEVRSGLETFTTTADVNETIYGFAVVDGADVTKLHMAFLLETPKAMDASTQQCDVVVRLTMSARGFGSSLQVSE